MNQRDNPSLGEVPRPVSTGFFYLDDIELSIVWEFAKRKRCTPHFENTELGNRMARAMRQAAPLAGTSWDKYLTVYLKPGQDIPAHEHRRHTMLWYPSGELTYLVPGITHSVPRVTVERLSVAMLISPTATPRLIPS